MCTIAQNICADLNVFSFTVVPNPDILTPIPAWAEAHAYVERIVDFFQEETEFICAVVCGTGNYTEENFFLKQPYNAAEIKRMLKLNSFQKSLATLTPAVQDPEGAFFEERLQDLLQHVAPRSKTLTPLTIQKIVDYVMRINPRPPGNHQSNDNYPIIHVVVGYKYKDNLSFEECPIFGWQYSVDLELTLDEIYQRSLIPLRFKENKFHVITASDNMRDMWRGFIPNDRLICKRLPPFKSADPKMVQEAYEDLSRAVVAELDLLVYRNKSKEACIEEISRLIDHVSKPQEYK